MVWTGGHPQASGAFIDCIFTWYTSYSFTHTSKFNYIQQSQQKLLEILLGSQRNRTVDTFR